MAEVHEDVDVLPVVEGVGALRRRALNKPGWGRRAKSGPGGRAAPEKAPVRPTAPTAGSVPGTVQTLGREAGPSHCPRLRRTGLQGRTSPGHAGVCLRIRWTERVASVRAQERREDSCQSSE